MLIILDWLFLEQAFGDLGSLISVLLNLDEGDRRVTRPAFFEGGYLNVRLWDVSPLRTYRLKRWTMFYCF